MLIVAGVIEVAPEDRERFLASRIEAIHATRLEPGCIEYCFAADCTDVGVVRVFERWSDATALSTHIAVVAERAKSASNEVTVLRRELVRYEIKTDG